MRPAAELAESGWRGRCFLVILADLVEEDPANFGPELNSVLARTGGHAVYDLLTERMPVLRARGPGRAIVADDDDHPAGRRRPGPDPGRGGPAATKAGPTRRGRAQLDYEAFVQNLVAMVASAVSTPDRVAPPRR